VIAGLTLIRTRNLPLLATGEAHGLVLIELAREILGLKEATSTRFEEEAVEPVVHAVGPRSEGPHPPREIQLELLPDPLVVPLYGHPGRITEMTDLAFGLNPDYARALAGAGLRTAATDPQGGRPYLHVLEGQRFHMTAAFLPQLKSRRGSPHPLFKGLLAAALAS
jgi:CTP synthase